MQFNELTELLVAENVYHRIKENEDAIFALIPELKVCKGFDQKSSWHIYDVYEHILRVVSGVEPVLTIRLAALFHDVGKPLAFTQDAEGAGHFWGHWDYSAEIFQRYGAALGLTDAEIGLVSSLIYYHDINIDKMTDEQIDQMIKDIGPQNIAALFAIKKADLLAQASEHHGLLANIQKQAQAVSAKAQETV